MLVIYLCGALATAMAAMCGVIRFFGRTGPFTQVAVAVLAGVLWPVVVVGALQAVGIALLANWIRPAAAGDADTPVPELLLTS